MFLAMAPSGTLAHGRHLLIDLGPYVSQFPGCLVLGAPIPLAFAEKEVEPRATISLCSPLPWVSGSRYAH